MRLDNAIGSKGMRSHLRHIAIENYCAEDVKPSDLRAKQLCPRFFGGVAYHLTPSSALPFGPVINY